MPHCSFCGHKENAHTPLCLSCGALRYQIDPQTPPHTLKKNKLKYSAIAAITVLTPGSLVVWALIGVSRLGSKNKAPKP